MKYVAIQIVGLQRVRAYENTNKKSEREPDFKADGVAVWLNERADEEA